MNTFFTPSLFNLASIPLLFAPVIIAMLYPNSVANFTAIPSFVLKYLDSFPSLSTTIVPSVNTPSTSKIKVFIVLSFSL